MAEKRQVLRHRKRTLVKGGLVGWPSHRVLEWLQDKGRNGPFVSLNKDIDGKPLCFMMTGGLMAAHQAVVDVGGSMLS